MAEMPQDPQREQARRNIRTALILGAISLGFLVAFVWSMSRPH
jgi:hypothetical protein